MPAPTNTSFATATDLTSIPQTITQAADFGGTTYDLYFRIPASLITASINELGVFAFGDLTVYKPETAVYVGPVGSPSLIFTAGGNQNIPIQLPTDTATEYFLKIITNSGNPSPANLTLLVQAAPAGTIQSGDIVIPDDTSEFPAAVLNPSANYAIRRFVRTFSASEQGDSSHLSGRSLMLRGPAEFATIHNLALFDSAYQLATLVPLTSLVPIIGNTSPVIRANQTTGKFWVGYAGDEAFPVSYVFSVSATGSVSAVETLGVWDDFRALASSPDESIIYVSTGVSSGAIRRWSMTSHTELSNLVGGTSGYNTQDILVLSNGDVLISLFKPTVTRDFKVKHYDASGTLLHTYNFGTDIRSVPPRLAHSIDNLASFWVFIPRDGSGPNRGKMNVYRVQISDGSFLVDRTYAMYEQGRYSGAATATPLAYFGASNSCPFWIAGHSGVLPVPLPTPLASQTPCVPQATIGNGGKGQAGCNVGGVGGGHQFTGDLGDVPNHPDPDDGEVLHGDPAAVFETWVELDHVDYPSDVVTTYRRAFEELDDDGDYEGGRKEAGVLSIGEIEHGLGNEQGGFEAASVEISLSDIRDRLFRILADDQDLDGDEVRLKGATDGARRAHTVARTLMRAIVQQNALQSFLLAGLTAVDWLFSDFGPFGPNRVDPNYTFNDLGAAAPQMTDDTKAQPIPLLYFEKSDEGATDPLTGLPASKGLLPGFYLGMFDLTGATLPDGGDRPGRTLAEAVALMQELVDDDADYATWESTLGFDIGSADIDELKAMGTVPGDYDRLANVIGYADLDEVLRHGTTAAPSGNLWGFIATGLGPWYAYTGVYGSSLSGGDPKVKPDRVKLDPATRSDIMVPGINWPFADPYFSLTNPETLREFWLTGILARGPLLDDHLNGVVNFGFNAIGTTENGNGTGRPIGRVEDAKQHRLENHWINRWSSGPYVTDLVYPKFNDGTAMVRTSSFRARQQFFKDQLGNEGLLVSWYTDKQQHNLEIVREWNRETESRTGVNQHGQIMDWGLDETVDPSDWPRVFHEADAFGPIVRTAGEERENKVSGVCDWDPDFEKFRAGPFQFQSDAGIQKYKGRIKQGEQIESQMLDNSAHFQWVLERRLARLAFGTTLLKVPLRMDPYLNYDVGRGILFNSEDGPGPDGYVDHPFIILRRRINIRERILTLTLWDVRDLLIETAFPGGLDQLFKATDDEDGAPLATDDTDLAPLAVL